MAQKESPIVEAAGNLGKIKHLAGAVVMDKNKQQQIIRLSEKTLGLLSEIESTAREGAKILSGESE